MPATVYQMQPPNDPREQPVLLPPPTPESVNEAIDEANANRLAARREGCAVALIPSPYDAEPFDRAVAMSIVEDLIHVWGAKRIATWVRNLAVIHGEQV